MLATPREWEWSGKGAVRFAPSGAFESPWGAGSWGSVPSPWRKDSLHVKLAGEANPSPNPSFDDPDPNPNPSPRPNPSHLPDAVEEGEVDDAGAAEDEHALPEW